MKIICIVGKSGSGKTYIAERFRHHPKYHLLDSWTTRPPREEGEKGHQYTTIGELGLEGFSVEEQIEVLKNTAVSYTYFNDNHYFIRYADLSPDKPNIFVVDEDGVEYLRQRLPWVETEVWSIESSEPDRFMNMLNRGDHIDKIRERLEWDKNREAHKFSDFLINDSTYGYDAITSKWKRWKLKRKGIVKVNKV